MKTKLLLLAFFLCTGYLLVQTTERSDELIYGKVVAITDGDTFKLLDRDSTLHRVRVANIDCPENKQSFSKRAKQFTSDAIFGKQVKLHVQSKDRNGRLIAEVIYNDSLKLSHELVKAGMAWHYVKYSRDPDLQNLEDEAKKDAIGLWQDPNAMAPWLWRSRKKTKTKQ